MKAFSQVARIGLTCLLTIPWGAFVNIARGESPSSHSESLSEIGALGLGDEASKKGAELIHQLNRVEELTSLEVLQSMAKATPIGRNWLNGLANSLHRRELTRNNGQPQLPESIRQSLRDFLADKEQNSEARAKAFDWLTRGDDPLRAQLLTTFLDDPSPELRFAAIAAALPNAKDAETLSSLLQSARHPEQITALIQQLKERDVQIDQAAYFGFLMQWRLIGPFDNVGMVNFNKVFEVESDSLAGAPRETYQGKRSEVSWFDFSTEDKSGSVDLAKAFNNEKGCIVYASTTFNSATDRPAELRLGSIIAHKVWVNNDLVMVNEIYHAASQIDQFIEPVQLRKGVNQVLIKLSQNEQTEDWAQVFQFQVRFTDSTGKAILPALEPN